MAELTGKTISELPAVSSLSNSDMFAVSSGGSSKKATYQTMFETIKDDLGIVIDSGESASVIDVPANSYIQQTFTFNKTFSSPPAVQVTLRTGTTSLNNLKSTGIYLAGAPTSTGFTVTIWNTHETTPQGRIVYWLAIGE